MKLFLVEAHDKLDSVTLDGLAAQCPDLHIEIFDSLLALLALPAETAPHLVILSDALAPTASPLTVHCLNELRRRGTPLALGNTADLLRVCLALLSLSGRPGAARVPAALGLARAERAPAPSHPLSERETEIVMLLCDGLQNKQIARRLDLSVSTVKTHVANLFRKIGATNRLDAICKFNNARAAERRTVWPAAPRVTPAWHDWLPLDRAA